MNTTTIPNRIAGPSGKFTPALVSWEKVQPHPHKGYVSPQLLCQACMGEVIYGQTSDGKASGARQGSRI